MATPAPVLPATSSPSVRHVAVRVDGGRVGAEFRLPAVGGVAAVRVRVGRGPGAVDLFAVVQPVTVRVGHCHVHACRVDFASVRQTVPVRVDGGRVGSERHLTRVVEPVVVGVDERRVEPTGHLAAVVQPVAVRVGHRRVRAQFDFASVRAVRLRLCLPRSGRSPASVRAHRRDRRCQCQRPSGLSQGRAPDRRRPRRRPYRPRTGRCRRATPSPRGRESPSTSSAFVVPRAPAVLVKRRAEIRTAAHWDIEYLTDTDPLLTTFPLAVSPSFPAVRDTYRGCSRVACGRRIYCLLEPNNRGVESRRSSHEPTPQTESSSSSSPGGRGPRVRRCGRGASGRICRVPPARCIPCRRGPGGRRYR